MKIQNWVKALGIQLDLQYPTYCDNNRNTWCARLTGPRSFNIFDTGMESYSQSDRCWVEGISRSPELALNKLCEAIRGKVLVFEPCDKTKIRQFDIPRDLTS
jgi:hypothetical protein